MFGLFTCAPLQTKQGNTRDNGNTFASKPLSQLEKRSRGQHGVCIHSRGENLYVGSHITGKHFKGSLYYKKGGREPLSYLPLRAHSEQNPLGLKGSRCWELETGLGKDPVC